MAESKPPDAFLSYTRFDDEHEDGKISEFRLKLAAEVRAETGEPFEIFQDIDGIGLGEPWAEKLEETLAEVRFFVPILTPTYFKSPICRKELEKFVEAEEKNGRKDLILPIRWRTYEILKNEKLRAADRLATLIASRQIFDWSDLRTRSFGDRKVKLALEVLARRIYDARQRVMSVLQHPSAATAPPEANPADERPRSTGRTRDMWPRISAKELVELMTMGQSAAEGLRRLEELRAQGRTAQTAGDSGFLAPGTVFRDIEAPWCPEIVVIPPGEFMMGSTGAEKESPQHLCSDCLSSGGRPIPGDVRGV
jgi:TIR domain